MRYLTVKEARDLIEARTGYSLTLMAIYRWIKEGKLTAIRLGWRFLVSESDIEAMLTPLSQKEKGGQV